MFIINVYIDSVIHNYISRNVCWYIHSSIFSFWINVISIFWIIVILYIVMHCVVNSITSIVFLQHVVIIISVNM